MPSFINDIALLFILATALSVLARFLRQPLVLAYLATGALIAYFGFVDVIGQDTFHIFADLGIMFLLFLAGLEINYTSLRLVGRVSLIVGMGQVMFTSIGGYLIATWLGFDTLSALYIAVALTFSSTIIIIKLLSDKKDLNSLYGKISVGMLLVQDIVAILILVILAGIEQGGGASVAQIGLTLAKALGLFTITFWLGRKILPHLFDEIAHSQELLFLASTAWVFLVAVGVSQLGFSIEIAGFLAGLGLANSSENFQIANRIRPLRDFFILIFFIILGTSLAMTDLSGIGAPTIIFSLFVLIGNPLIVLTLMGLMGFKRRTGFLTGLTVAQISEFSLILAALGLKLGHISTGVVALITGVGVITITVSSYLIIHGNFLFRIMHKFLRIFEKTKTNGAAMPRDIKKPVVLIGFHRTGQSLARNLATKDLIIVDFDPEISKRLDQKGYRHVFGDISDPEIFDAIVSYKTRLVISTSPDVEDNKLIISRFRKLRHRPGIVVRAETEQDALDFYRAGADYVLVPHLSSGNHLGKLLATHSTPTQLKRLKAKDIKLLEKEFGTN